MERRNIGLRFLSLSLLVAVCCAGFSCGKEEVAGDGNRAGKSAVQTAAGGPSEKHQGTLREARGAGGSAAGAVRGAGVAASGALPQQSRPEGAGTVTPPGTGAAGAAGLLLVVDKSAHTLTLFENGVPVKTYHVATGDGGPEDKEVAGNHRTPEGTFYICEKIVIDPPDEYLGSRWLRLSYPGVEDAARGLQQDLIDQNTYEAIVAACSAGQVSPQETALGGGVGIHGGSRPEWGDCWTWGCIGLTNADVEDFYDRVAVGTPVIVRS
ncbi:L,D-transpeptidase family protein [Thermodesulfitimonas sp.]